MKKVRFNSATGLKTEIDSTGKAIRSKQFKKDGPFYPVLRAPRPFPVVVTEKDIEMANCTNPESCALALATKGLVVKAHFFKGVAYLLFFNEKGEGYVYFYRLSGKAVEQIRNFDAAKGFVPGIYFLQIPKISTDHDMRNKLNKERKENGYVPKRGANRNIGKVSVKSYATRSLERG